MNQSALDSGTNLADHLDADAPVLEDNKLKLADGVTSATVYVRPFRQGDAVVGGFSEDKGGTYHSQGLTWKFDKGSPNLALTFKLQTGVSSLSSTTIIFSTVVNHEQTASLPPAQATDSFTVNFTGGGTHDPKIVVTPIGQVD